MASQRLIDALPTKERTSPMRILCLGHLRTGTISLDAALKVLEFKPYHGKAILDMEQAKAELPLVSEALELGLLSEDELRRSGKKRYGREEFDKIVAGYGALLEPSFLYKDFLTAYPEAKVILTTRDTESWLASMRATIFPIVAWDWPTYAQADPDFAAKWWEYVKIVMRYLCGDAWTPYDASAGTGGIVSPEAEQVAAERYEAHYADVRRLVPKEKLLEWHPKDGWKPLCEFLDVQPPFVKEFPKVNEKGDFIKFHQGWFESLKQAKGEQDRARGEVSPSKRCDTIK